MDKNYVWLIINFHTFVKRVCNGFYLSGSRALHQLFDILYSSVVMKMWYCNNCNFICFVVIFHCNSIVSCVAVLKSFIFHVLLISCAMWIQIWLNRAKAKMNKRAYNTYTLTPYSYCKPTWISPNGPNTIWKKTYRHKTSSSHKAGTMGCWNTTRDPS